MQANVTICFPRSRSLYATSKGNLPYAGSYSTTVEILTSA